MANGPVAKMKKNALYISFIALCAWGGLMIYPVFAQTDIASGAITVGGTGVNASVGVPDYPDSLWIEKDCSIDSCTTLLSTSTAYTILSYELLDSSLLGSFTWACGSYNLAGRIFDNWVGNLSLDSSFYSFGSDIPVHCSGNLSLDSFDGYAIIQYVPWDTRLYKSSEDINYSDWIHVNGWLIFLLAFGPIGVLYSLLRR